MGKKKKKTTWFSVIKRLFITEPQSRLDNKKDNKRRRWVFRLLKMKDVPGLSTSSAAREMLPWKASSSSSTQSHSLAATKIQSAFRGYLARKALAALKGVVKLQALIRGWAVRRQAIKTLKCLQSLVNIQSQVFSKRSSCERLMKDGLHVGFCDQKDINVDLNSQKRWDDSTLTKEEIIALFATKREGCVKRERVKEYYLNHRRSAETERERAYGRRRYWLEEWVDSQLAKSEGPKKKLETRVSCNGRNREEINGRVRNFEKQYEAEMCESLVPRRSHHHRKQRSIGDEHSFAASPSYMASTESAKAKTRSLSSPRLRPLSFDVCSEISSPYKHKLSPISSINSELTSSSWIGNHVSSPHRSSPCFKGLPGPVKSNMSSKDLRIRGIYHHQS